MKRREFLGVAGLGVTLPAAQYLRPPVRRSEGSGETTQAPNDDTTMSQLGSSGTLKVQNTAETALQVDVRLDRTRGDDETTLFRINSEMDPDDSVIAVGLLSDPGRYRVAVETAGGQEKKEWEVADDGEPANVTIRVLDDGKPNVNVLFLH